MSFKADVDTKGYEMAMRRLGNDVLPETIAETLNETAQSVTDRSLRYMKRRHTIRTKFTTNSITNAGAKPYRALNKAKGKSIDRMFSRAGTKSRYMSMQDRGGTARPSKGSKYPVATLASRTGKSIEKSIARRYNLRNMGDVSSDGRYFMGEPKQGGTPGLYERTAGGKRLRMLRNLSQASVSVSPTRWHSDAAEELGNRRMIAARFRRNADRRLKRMSRRGRRA